MLTVSDIRKTHQKEIFDFLKLWSNLVRLRSKLIKIIYIRLPKIQESWRDRKTLLCF